MTQAKADGLLAFWFQTRDCVLFLVTMMYSDGVFGTCP